MIEIKLSINAESSSQISEAINFLQSLNASPEVSEPAAKKPAVKKPAAKKLEVKKPVVEPVEAEVVEKSEELGIAELRGLLALKVGAHRGAIKSKLTELGANNITTLAQDQYSAFETFLNELS